MELDKALEAAAASLHNSDPDNKTKWVWLTPDEQAVRKRWFILALQNFNAVLGEALNEKIK